MNNLHSNMDRFSLEYLTKVMRGEENLHSNMDRFSPFLHGKKLYTCTNLHSNMDRFSLMSWGHILRDTIIIYIPIWIDLADYKEQAKILQT